jgi:hypothetical protein
MRKKNQKTLKLNKKAISNINSLTLNGGSSIPTADCTYTDACPTGDCEQSGMYHRCEPSQGC